MKRFKLLFFCLAGLNVLFAQPAKFLDDIYYYIENTSVFEQNQEEGRTYYLPDKSISLNGEWKFFYSETPEGVPKDFLLLNSGIKAGVLFMFHQTGKWKDMATEFLEMLRLHSR